MCYVLCCSIDTGHGYMITTLSDCAGAYFKAAETCPTSSSSGGRNQQIAACLSGVFLQTSGSDANPQDIGNLLHKVAKFWDIRSSSLVMHVITDTPAIEVAYAGLHMDHIAASYLHMLTKSAKHMLQCMSTTN